MKFYNGFARSIRRTKTGLIDFVTTKGKQNLIVIGALVVLVAVFGILNPNFVDKSNIVSMTQSLAPYAIMALGVTFVIATGGIDLSIGTVCIASAVIAGKLYMDGMALNLKIHPSALVANDGVDKLEDITKAYFEQGGMEVQYNVVDAATLRKAQQNPDEYHNLVVRIAGFSAYFVDMTPAMQEDIISRAEHNI